MTRGKVLENLDMTLEYSRKGMETEVELVAIDDVMGQILWTRHFLVAQGHYILTTTVYQDNKSRKNCIW